MAFQQVADQCRGGVAILEAVCCGVRGCMNAAAYAYVHARCLLQCVEETDERRARSRTEGREKLRGNNGGEKERQGYSLRNGTSR
jgi:hypothetical protein